MNVTETKFPLSQVVATPSAAGEKLRLPEQPRAPNGEWFSKRIKSEAELRAFVENHQAEIAQKARALSFGTRQDAEDLAQELYPRLLRTLRQSPAGIENAWGMAHTILARHAIDQYRTLRRTRERIKRLEFPDSIPERPKATPDADTEALNASLNQLPARLKSIVVGIFLEGCKAKDIAAKLGLSESRLAELKALALRQLREVLK